MTRDPQEYAKRLKAKRLAAGLCPACGSVLPPNATCSNCRDARHALYHQRIRDGLCPKCGDQARAGYTLCQPCANNAAVYQRRWRDKKRQERGRPALP